ncbi:MAG: hypothetical protein KUG78_00320 [Kangiellaceae bacterium]|nr:hypothetical protein [Kangiellaceae bacterium]
MSENSENENNEVIEGRVYDTPLVVPGFIDAEPERYVAEKPFDLTRFEYSILKKSYKAEFWFNIVSGGTGGIVVSVIGKALAALIAKQQPKLETWEIVAVILGVLVSLLLKYAFKSDDDKAKDELMRVVDNHFETNKPRHLHLTKGDPK